jgi:hypothetical protein
MQTLVFSIVHRYLYEFLFGWTISALTRADSLVTEQEALSESLSLQSQKSKGGKKPAKSKKPRRVRPYIRDLQYIEGLRELCGGYYKVKRIRIQMQLCFPLVPEHQLPIEFKTARLPDSTELLGY